MKIVLAADLGGFDNARQVAVNSLCRWASTTSDRFRPQTEREKGDTTVSIPSPEGRGFLKGKPHAYQTAG